MTYTRRVVPYIMYPGWMMSGRYQRFMLLLTRLGIESAGEWLPAGIDPWDQNVR